MRISGGYNMARKVLGKHDLKGLSFVQPTRLFPDDEGTEP